MQLWIWRLEFRHPSDGFFVVSGMCDQPMAEFAGGVEAVCPAGRDGLSLRAPIEDVPIGLVEETVELVELSVRQVFEFLLCECAE